MPSSLSIQNPSRLLGQRGMILFPGQRSRNLHAPHQFHTAEHDVAIKREINQRAGLPIDHEAPPQAQIGDDRTVAVDQGKIVRADPNRDRCRDIAVTATIERKLELRAVVLLTAQFQDRLRQQRRVGGGRTILRPACRGAEAHHGRNNDTEEKMHARPRPAGAPGARAERRRASCNCQTRGGRSDRASCRNWDRSAH